MHFSIEAAQALRQSNVLVATIDLEIRKMLADVLETSSLNAIWVNTVEGIKSGLRRGNIAACLCSFWLLDGTYRDVLRCVKRQPGQIPLVVLCPPTCSPQQQEFLGALNIGTFGFICYPYRGQDLERVLFGSMQSHGGEIHMPAPSEDSLNSALASPGLRRAS